LGKHFVWWGKRYQKEAEDKNFFIKGFDRHLFGGQIGRGGKFRLLNIV